MAVDEDKRLDVRDNRLHRQTASVHVGSERAADGQSVGTGLLLRDRPRAMIDEILDQLRPFDSGLHFDDSALMIEMQNIVHRSDVDERGTGPELLPTHRMAAAAKRQFSRGFTDRRDELGLRARTNDVANARRIQLRMNIVDEYGPVARVENRRRRRRRHTGDLEKLTAA